METSQSLLHLCDFRFCVSGIYRTRLVPMTTQVGPSCFCFVLKVLFIYQLICPYVYLLTYLFIHSSIHPTHCPSLPLAVRPIGHPSVPLAGRPSHWPSVRPIVIPFPSSHCSSIHQTFCSSVFLSFHPFICPSTHLIHSSNCPDINRSDYRPSSPLSVCLSIHLLLIYLFLHSSFCLIVRPSIFLPSLLFGLFFFCLW